MCSSLRELMDYVPFQPEKEDPLVDRLNDIWQNPQASFWMPAELIRIIAQYASSFPDEKEYKRRYNETNDAQYLLLDVQMFRKELRVHNKMTKDPVTIFQQRTGNLLDELDFKTHTNFVVAGAMTFACLYTSAALGGNRDIYIFVFGPDSDARLHTITYLVNYFEPKSVSQKIRIINTSFDNEVHLLKTFALHACQVIYRSGKILMTMYALQDILLNSATATGAVIVDQSIVNNMTRRGFCVIDYDLQHLRAREFDVSVIYLDDIPY